MRILVIEDEEKVGRFIKMGLEQSAYAVDWVTNGEEGLDLARVTQYHGIVLDMMLPDKDGLQILRELRAQGVRTPVLALTARASLEERVKGLNSGCDDYLPKPFAFDELLARLRALLRRETQQRTAIQRYGGLTLDPVRHTVTRDGRAIDLTNKEYALLLLLLRQPGQVCARKELMESIWGYDLEGGSNILEVYMNSLRRKIDRNATVKLLHTVRGVGYVLREEPDESDESQEKGWG